MSLRLVRRVFMPVLATAVIGAGGTAALVATPTSAFAASPSLEAQFVAKLNAAREANGLRPYAVAGDLVAVARAHSAAMAGKDELYHNPSLTSDVASWQAVGENVGEGPDVSAVHTAFMQSPEHRANILDHDFTQVGVGVSVDKSGTVWVTEDFREPMGGAGTTVSTHSGSHHSVRHAATGHSSRTHVTARRTTGSTASHGAVAPRSTSRHRSVLSPRQALMRRLHLLRRHPHRRAADPVAQAFRYWKTLSRLAG